MGGQCQTCKHCRDNPELDKNIRLFAERLKAKTTQASSYAVWRWLKANCGYPMSAKSLIRHMEICLGVKRE